MEMVRISPGTRRTKRLRRAVQNSNPAVLFPLLDSKDPSRRSRRSRPTFGDAYNPPLGANSSYRPPEFIGADVGSHTEQESTLGTIDDYLFFNAEVTTPTSTTLPRARSLHKTRRRQSRIRKDNPVQDLANCFSHGCCCVQCVRTQEIGIIENFGQFEKILAPGRHCLLWPCANIAGRLSLRVQQLDVLCETKTLDNVFVRVQVSVQYRVLVEKSFDAYYRLSDPSIQIQSYAFDVVRSTLPKMTVDEAFVQKSVVADCIMERLFERMHTYGYEIVGALVTNLTLDEKVKTSMNEIEASKRLKVAIPHQAEAEKIRIVKKAEACAEAMHLSGVGTARARIELAKGMKESVLDGSSNMNGGGDAPQELMQLILVTQYLDALMAVKPSEVILRATPSQVLDMYEGIL